MYSVYVLTPLQSCVCSVYVLTPVQSCLYSASRGCVNKCVWCAWCAWCVWCVWCAWCVWCVWCVWSVRKVCVCVCVVCVCAACEYVVYVDTAVQSDGMGWQRLVGSLKVKVFFAKEPNKRDDILQKRPIILRSLLLVATPYEIAQQCQHTLHLRMLHTHTTHAHTLHILSLWYQPSLCAQVCGVCVV